MHKQKKKKMKILILGLKFLLLLFPPFSWVPGCVGAEQPVATKSGGRGRSHVRRRGGKGGKSVISVPSGRKRKGPWVTRWVLRSKGLQTGRDQHTGAQLGDRRGPQGPGRAVGAPGAASASRQRQRGTQESPPACLPGSAWLAELS